MIKVILLNFGYAESANLSFFPMAPTDPKRDRKESFIDLAKFLKMKYEKQFSSPLKPKDCCATYVKRGENFCAQCGKRLVANDFDFDQFRDWLLQLGLATNDSYHYSYGEYEETWTPDVEIREVLKCKPSEILVVTEAEECILAALAHPRQEGRDIDSLFKDSSNGNISYWG
jgi:hypothetical protein